jgi:hypothetical protein
MEMPGFRQSKFVPAGSTGPCGARTQNLHVKLSIRVATFVSIVLMSSATKWERNATRVPVCIVSRALEDHCGWYLLEISLELVVVVTCLSHRAQCRQFTIEFRISSRAW